MPHIHTEPGQHDLTASAFIVRTDFDEPKIMLHMHKKLGAWMQFGGHVELDENIWDSLTHELLEESGYRMDQLNLIEIAPTPVKQDENAVPHPIPFSVNTFVYDENHKHIDLCYVFTTNDEPSAKVGKDESSEIRYMSKQDIIDLPKNEVIDSVYDECMYIFERLLP